VNPSALYNAAVDVLNTAVAVLDANSALGAPDRRYVSVGDPALDCDQITVAATARPALVASSGAGLDAARHHRRARILIAEFRIAVVRCGYPTLDEHANPPSDVDLEAAAASLYAEGWALFVGLNDAARGGSLGEWCGEWSVDSLDPIGQEGAVAGWVVSASASVSSP
jgi:hypothetical protein